MTTNLNYPKPVNPDDGCNWIPVILWRMNAGARRVAVLCSSLLHGQNQFRGLPRKSR